MSDVVWTESVARVGRSAYRARRSPSVEEFGGFGMGSSDPTGFLVTRTHDVDVACALVSRLWAYEFGGPLPAPTLRWVRLVPWSEDSAYDQHWEELSATDRGAIPVVEFEAYR